MEKRIMEGDTPAGEEMSVRFAPLVGRAMKTLRERHGGLSQERLARKAEVSRETVRRVESGEAETTTTMVDRLLAAMGYDADDLLKEMEVGAMRVKLHGRKSVSAQQVRQHPLAVAVN